MLILVAIHSPFAIWNIPVEQVSRLRREFPAHTFLHAVDDAQALALVPEADVAFSSQIGRAHLLAAGRLKWIHSPAAGVGGMLFREMIECDVLLTNSRGMSADTMAEHVLAVTLALFRNLPLAVVRQVDHVWAQDEISERRNRTLQDSHVVLVGLGAIGSAVAWRMAALGARVTGIRRRTDAPPVKGVSTVLDPEGLSAAVAEADVVVVAAPHTRATRGMIGMREFSAMKPNAILVNVSRGRLVDELALTSALEAGRLGGAALDVFEREPLPPDSPLWNMPNVLITPHTSGFRSDHWEAAVALFMKNLRRFESGEPLLNVVDKHAGY
jgi:phosphoglycerate dehydrogenase-like enzyme